MFIEYVTFNFQHAFTHEPQGKVAELKDIEQYLKDPTANVIRYGEPFNIVSVEVPYGLTLQEYYDKFAEVIRFIKSKRK